MNQDPLSSDRALRDEPVAAPSPSITRTGRMVEIDIEEDQAAELEVPFQEARQAAAAGRIGIVFAQVFTDHAKVCFIEQEWSDEIKAVLSRRAAAKRTALQAEREAASAQTSETDETKQRRP